MKTKINFVGIFTILILLLGCMGGSDDETVSISAGIYQGPSELNGSYKYVDQINFKNGTEVQSKGFEYGPEYVNGLRTENYTKLTQLCYSTGDYKLGDGILEIKWWKHGCAYKDGAEISEADIANIVLDVIPADSLKFQIKIRNITDKSYEVLSQDPLKPSVWITWVKI